MNTPPLARLVEILLVEDNPADVVLTKEGLEQCKIANQLHVVQTGEEALAFLQRQEPYADAVRPDLILLDLNLPRLSGRELLAQIKGPDHLKRIPVVVLTSSRAEEDVVRSYDLGANCYVSKPLTFAEYLKIIKAIEEFWFIIVTLPPRVLP
jgi:two-component system response regulator